MKTLVARRPAWRNSSVSSASRKARTSSRNARSAGARSRSIRVTRVDGGGAPAWRLCAASSKLRRLLPSRRARQMGETYHAGDDMDFTFTEEQTLLRSSLAAYLADQYDFDTRRRVV